MLASFSLCYSPFRCAALTVAADEGKPILRVTLGDGATLFNSVELVDMLDLETSPFMDFWIRTTSQEPLAFLFQVGGNGSTEWKALNLIGKQTGFEQIDALPQKKINDGEWHRVTWDLKRLCREQLGEGNVRTKNLVLGSWDKPSQPIKVELRNFAHGKRNTLD